MNHIVGLTFAACSILADASPINLAKSQARLLINTGDSWLCGRSALLKWDFRDDASDETPVAIYLHHESNKEPQRIDGRSLIAGDRQVYIALNCEGLGLDQGSASSWLTITKDDDKEEKPFVLANTQSFGISQSHKSASESPSTFSGETVALNWPGDGSSDNVEVYLYGRPVSGQAVLIAQTTAERSESGEVSVTIPDELTTDFDTVFIRLLGNGRYFDSHDYALVPEATEAGKGRRRARQASYDVEGGGYPQHFVRNENYDPLQAKQAEYASGFASIQKVGYDDTMKIHSQLGGGWNNAKNTVASNFVSAGQNIRHFKPVSAVTDVVTGTVGAVLELGTGLIGGITSGFNKLGKKLGIGIGTMMGAGAAKKETRYGDSYFNDSW